MDYPTRRDVVVGGAAMALAAGSASADPAKQAPVTATGIVTEIIAAPGPTLIKGPPVADVLVSNGREVTRTDAAGRYSLPVTPGQAIFIVKPSGFRVPVDSATKLPLFSYVHEPDGTPAALAFRYAGLAPTGPLPPPSTFSSRVSPRTRSSTSSCSPIRNRNRARRWSSSVTMSLRR